MPLLGTFANAVNLISSFIQAAPGATPQTADTPFAKASGSGSAANLQSAASSAVADEDRRDADASDDLNTDAASTVAPSTLRSESGDVDGGNACNYACDKFCLKWQLFCF